MVNLCCTSDFNGDGLLSVEDYRIYYLWSKYVDKNQSFEDQAAVVKSLYDSLFPLSPALDVTDLPTLACADYNSDLDLSVEDYRIYYLWSKYVNPSDPLSAQLSLLDILYASTFPASPSIVSTRVPRLLDPANCALQHGWFVTPWHSTVEIGAQPYGWLQ